MPDTVTPLPLLLSQDKMWVAFSCTHQSNTTASCDFVVADHKVTFELYRRVLQTILNVDIATTGMKSPASLSRQTHFTFFR
jgi:hypothetical protein